MTGNEALGAGVETREARIDVLVGAVYDFLITEGYHGHYPSAEEQAEKFVNTTLYALVEDMTCAGCDAGTDQIEGGA